MDYAVIVPSMVFMALFAFVLYGVYDVHKDIKRAKEKADADAAWRKSFVDALCHPGTVNVFKAIADQPARSEEQLRDEYGRDMSALEEAERKLYA